MNGPLLKGFLKLLEETTRHNAELFETRSERDGKEATVLSWAVHSTLLLDALNAEAEQYGAVHCTSALEAAIALVTGVYLDLLDHDAAIVFGPGTAFCIYSEGKPWIEGDMAVITH